MNMRAWLVERRLRSIIAAPNPAWNISKEESRSIQIRWPRRYQWDAAGDWVDILKYGFRSRAVLAEVDDIPQPFKGTVVFDIEIAGRRSRVAIGYSDYPPIDVECADACDLYFKMQYARGGYGRENIVPGGYVPDGKRLYFQLSKLRQLRDSRDYATDVSGRFSLDYSPEIRTAAIAKLTEQTLFSFDGGLAKVSYDEFLRGTARAKISIDLPGLGPLCFRLMNYLAIGSCVVAYPHEALLHVPLVDREHIVYCKADMSDVVELCEYYLTHDEERERIASNARSFFDKNLHKDNLTNYYLRTCLDRLD